MFGSIWFSYILLGSHAWPRRLFFYFRSHCKIKSAHFQYDAYWLVLIGWEGRTHFLQYAWRQKCALFFEIIPGQKVCLETFYQEIDINKKVCTSKYFILFTINSKLFCLFFFIIPGIGNKTTLKFTSRSYNGNNFQRKLCCETSGFAGAPTLLPLQRILPGIWYVDKWNISGTLSIL